MVVESIALGQVLAPVVAAVSVIVLYHYLGSEYLGADENPYWNALRRTLLSAGDSTVRKKTNFALTNAVSEDEYVGSVEFESGELAHVFEDAGAAQGVLSGLKYRPSNVNPSRSSEAEYESGSMVFRESSSDLLPDALALRQTHVFWFDTGHGVQDVYAHYEYSSLNPLVAWRHYRAVGQDAARGVDRIRSVLESVDADFV